MSMQDLKDQMEERGYDYSELDNEDPNNHEFDDWKQQEQFLELVTDRLFIFDPLDRLIKGSYETENQAIPRENLKKEIEKMQGIEGKNLSAPMSLEASKSLFKLFENSEKECAELAKFFINDAKQ